MLPNVDLFFTILLPILPSLLLIIWMVRLLLLVQGTGLHLHMNWKIISFRNPTGLSMPFMKKLFR